MLNGKEVRHANRQTRQTPDACQNDLPRAHLRWPGPSLHSNPLDGRANIHSLSAFPFGRDYRPVSSNIPTSTARSVRSSSQSIKSSAKVLASAQ
jgi:hypothetical protein